MENTIIITFRKQLQHMMAALCRASMMLPQTLLESCSMVFPYMVLCSIFHHQKEKSILNQDRVREFSTQIKPFLERIFEPQLENCSDCVFKQIEDGDLDECGGQEVADGSEEDGTVYRYIASGLFPYNIQCYRGDISLSQRLRGGNWQTFRVNNSCGRGGGSENGCSVFNKEWADENGCTPGNCPHTWNSLRRPWLYFQIIVRLEVSKKEI